MRTMRVLVALLIALLAIVPGCLSGPSPGDTDAAGPTASARPAFTPQAHGATGDGARGYVQSFAMEHPYRMRDLPSHEVARAYLEAEAAGFGLEVFRQEYTSDSASADSYAHGINILARLNGTQAPNEWIVVSAHYDSEEKTPYAAWDDGAGVAVLLEMARAWSGSGFKRSIVFAFFDGEEQGLLGSKGFVKEFVPRDDVTIVANLNIDPPGLNWPCRNPDGTFLPLSVRHSNKTAPGQAAIQQAVLGARDAVGVPDDAWDYSSGGMAVARVNGMGPGGTSDHKSFDAADVPNLFLGGTVATSAGPAQVMGYALHSPVDTLEQMDARCGGASELEKGFQAILDMAAHTLAAVDRVPTDVLTALPEEA